MAAEPDVLSTMMADLMAIEEDVRSMRWKAEAHDEGALVEALLAVEAHVEVAAQTAERRRIEANLRLDEAPTPGRSTDGD